jgi:ABC-type multidrug transport system fused ATPase/permease subunit
MRHLGQYLRDMDALSEEELQSALVAQRRSGARLGDILRERGHVREAVLDLALALQHQRSIAKISLAGAAARVLALTRRCALGGVLPTMCVAAGLLAGVMSFPIIFYFYSRWAWDIIGLSSNLSVIVSIGCGTLLLMLLASGLEAFATYLCIHVTAVLLQDIAIALHDNLLSRSLARVDGAAGEVVASIYAQNLEQFAGNIESLLIKLPKAIASLVMFMGIIFFSSLGIALLVAVLAPVAIVMPPLVSSMAQPYLRREVGLLGKAMSQIEPFFQYFRTTGGALLERATRQLGFLMEEHHLNQASKWFFWNSSFNVGSFLNLLTLSSILIYGGWCVLNGSLSLAMLFGMYLAVSMILPRFNDIFEAYFHLTTAGHHAGIIEQQLQIATVGRESPAQVDSVNRLGVTVPHFSYKGRTVLTDFTAEFLPGRLYLLTGESGSGKSTLARLLAGIEEAPGVKVVIEYADAASPQKILGHVAYIGQEHGFFEDMDLDANIACQPNPDTALRGRIQDGLQHLQLNIGKNRDISTLSVNAQFSGGEKQRLHVLRGVLAPQKIRIFDEPTASLDPASAAQVKQLLAAVPHDEIRLVISHDREWPVSQAQILTLPTLSVP